MLCRWNYCSYFCIPTIGLVQKFELVRLNYDGYFLHLQFLYWLVWFLGSVVLSHYAVFLLFMYLVSNFTTWVGFIFILLYCYGIDIGHCSLGHWIFLDLLFLTVVNIHEFRSHLLGFLFSICILGFVKTLENIVPIKILNTKFYDCCVSLSFWETGISVDCLPG